MGSLRSVNIAGFFNSALRSDAKRPRALTLVVHNARFTPGAEQNQSHGVARSCYRKEKRRLAVRERTSSNGIHVTPSSDKRLCQLIINTPIIFVSLSTTQHARV